MDDKIIKKLTQYGLKHGIVLTGFSFCPLSKDDGLNNIIKDYIKHAGKGIRVSIHHDPEMIRILEKEKHVGRP